MMRETLLLVRADYIVQIGGLHSMENLLFIGPDDVIGKGPDQVINFSCMHVVGRSNSDQVTPKIE